MRCEAGVCWSQIDSSGSEFGTLVFGPCTIPIGWRLRGSEFSCYALSNREGSVVSATIPEPNASNPKRRDSAVTGRHRVVSGRHPATRSARELVESGTQRPTARLGRLIRNSTLRLTFLYIVVGLVWIYTGDAMVSAVSGGNAELERWLQTFKGAIYILVTGGLLYWLLMRSMHRLAQASAERIAARRQLNVFAENLPGMVYRCRRDERYTMEYVSSGSIEVTGFSPDELLGMGGENYAELIHPDDRDDVRLEIDAAIKASKEFEITYRLRDKKGQWRWLWERGRETDPGIIEGVVFDETERMELNERMRQSARLRVMGQLSAGVAHDFNNVLSIIIGQAQLADRSVERESEVHRRLHAIQHAANRGAELSRQLLLFGQQGQDRSELIDLSQAMNGLRRLLERTTDDRIQIRFDVGSDPGFVRGDPSMFDQAVVNLVVNSVDAIEGSGTVTVSASRRKLDAETLEKIKPTPTPGDYVVISVEDTGVGIKPEDLPRIFEPFFTTKRSGEGTGLGLYSVTSAVERMRGGISVSSTYGRGCKIELWLPASTPTEAESRRMELDPTRVLVRGSGTVLIVEDSHLVREVAAEYLRDCGYQVIEAVCVTDAMQWAETNSGQIDVAVVDILMHGMTGHRLVDLIKIWHPRMKTLFVTGYSDEYLEARGLSLRGLVHISKPLKLDELGRQVRSLAGAPAHLSARRPMVASTERTPTGKL